MNKQKLEEFKDFIYDIELTIGLCSSQSISEDTNIKTYIDNFKKEIEQYQYFKDKLNLIYYNDLNESTGKTYLEILNEFA